MALVKVIRLGSRILRRAALCLLGSAALWNIESTVAVSLSVVVSLAVYAAAFGLEFSLGFVVLLFLHELGHMIAARVVGVSSKGPMFVPFVGAVIHLDKEPRNAKMEANIAIGGPALGSLSAFGCLALYFWTQHMLLLVLSYTACLLNLFNLIPCYPLDGGRIAGAISSRLWWFGTLVLGILFFFTHNILILLIFGVSLFRLWQGDRSNDEPGYFRLATRQRLKVAWWYFGLVTVLGFLAVYLVDLLH